MEINSKKYSKYKLKDLPKKIEQIIRIKEQMASLVGLQN